MPLSSFALVSFDLDGTIFRKAALTAAAPALGIGEKWNHYDDLEARKRITKKACLDAQFKLLAGKRLEEVLREVSKVEVMENIRESVEKLRGLRLGVILVTDNPDFLCTYLVERFGFNGFVASKVPVENQPAGPTLKKIVLVAGRMSHDPGEHEFFAGCAILMKLLQQTPGVFPVLARDGWPKRAPNSRSRSRASGSRRTSASSQTRSPAR